VDRRIRERRREIARGRGRYRLTLAALVVLALGCVTGFLWLRSSDSLSVARVTGPASGSVVAAGVSHALSDTLGKNLLRLSTSELEKRLLLLPYVRDARVLKRYPDELEVRLVQYVPAVRLQDADGGFWLVADDGRVLESVGVSDADSLPLVVAAEERVTAPGVGVSESVADAVVLALTVADARAWPANHPVAGVRVDASGQAVMVLEGGAEIKIGTCEKLDAKLTVATAVIDQYLREGKSPEYVDVRIPARVVAKKRDS